MRKQGGWQLDRGGVVEGRCVFFKIKDKEACVN